ncbi:CD3072 family TudS-related putative desulfidase [Proteiniborus sp. MB09-C3]|uniref:CD3072 family TudS-related putative desulfidase n=1 Tax=Proteiniborus sp. MB09-C3 TaxID=3050072 RepID=UPI002553E57B|nr:CD3072 family TudS-related putative desulfidase [Proteiniborus sp. MB09-C3]WIV11286.1 hypothetical protein QO263_14155 [Proteiniborus sp. MB09-C3]
MDKVKKVILLCHCVINEKSKVKKVDINPPGDIKEFINLLIDNEIGIIQLPCPELTCYGLKRWGHVKEQFDTLYYRKICRELFQPYLEQIQEYLANNYKIVGLVGIEGSPTCGVYRTCSGKWGGQLGNNPYLQDTLNTITLAEESGILIDEIKNILNKNNISFPLIDFNKNDMTTFMDKIKPIIEQ